MNLKRLIGLSIILFVPLMIFSSQAHSAETVLLNYKDAELVPIIIDLGKKFHKNFIIDPSVRGKITIQTNVPVSQDEAYEALLIALQINGYTIVPHGSYLKVMQAQNALRNNLPTYFDTLPEDLHESMITVIFHLKHAAAKEVYGSLGPIMSSRLGELRFFEDSNILICTDWVSNIRRLKKIIDEVDTPRSLSQSKGK